MSISGSPRVALPTRRSSVQASPSLVAIATRLIQGGAFMALGSLLTGLLLSHCGMLTLIWIVYLPATTCAGAAAIFLGIMMVCVQALHRHQPSTISGFSVGPRP